MDDFLQDTLKNSVNEYSQRLINILTPEIYNGFQSMLNESYQICNLNKEKNKYLMTFQNCIKLIPDYNQILIENECKRIIEKTGCNYLEDLITATHIILLKNLTTIRVGNRQKKIDISIPKLNIFIHKVYINVGRKLYQNVDLFMIEVPSIQKMKNKRIIEIIIEKCILDTIRDSMPYENIIRSYLDENEEHEDEELEQEIINEKVISDEVLSLKEKEDDKKYESPSITDMNKDEPVITKVSFDPNLIVSSNVEINDEINDKNNNKIKLNEENNDGKIKILDNDNNDIKLDILDLNDEIDKLPNAILKESEKKELNLDDILNLNEISLDAI